MTLLDILSSDFVKTNGNKIELSVAREPVWDFKTQNGELRLIHEPVPGSNEYETVTIKDLEKGLTIEEAGYKIVSETRNEDIVEVEGIKKGSKIGINFVL